jgi:hypothetical protein
MVSDDQFACPSSRPPAPVGSSHQSSPPSILFIAVCGNASKRGWFSFSNFFIFISFYVLLPVLTAMEEPFSVHQVYSGYRCIFLFLHAAVMHFEFLSNVLLAKKGAKHNIPISGFPG